MKMIQTYIVALGLLLSKIDSERLERKIEDERRFRIEIHPPDSKNQSIDYIDYYPVLTAEF